MTEQSAGLWEKWRAIVSEQIAMGSDSRARHTENSLRTDSLWARQHIRNLIKASRRLG